LVGDLFLESLKKNNSKMEELGTKPPSSFISELICSNKVGASQLTQKDEEHEGEHEPRDNVDPLGQIEVGAKNAPDLRWHLKGGLPPSPIGAHVEAHGGPVEHVVIHPHAVVLRHYRWGRRAQALLNTKHILKFY
jgi:hypothetical protein